MTEEDEYPLLTPADRKMIEEFVCYGICANTEQDRKDIAVWFMEKSGCGDWYKQARRYIRYAC